MDPNETLNRMRTITSREAEWDNLTLAELAELFEAMDGWLTRGGFLPEAWCSPSTELAAQRATKVGRMGVADRKRS